MTESSSSVDPSKSEVTVQGIWDLALGEFHGRLSKDPDSIPPHTLGTTLATLSRVLERENEAPLQSEQFDPLDSLESLPPPRQKELLIEELERIDALRVSYIERLKDLEK